MYTPSDNIKIKMNARAFIRTRLWPIWQLLLVYALIEFALSWIPELIFGKQVAQINAVLAGTATTLPREIDYGPLIGFYILNGIFSALLIPLSYGILRNVTLWSRGVRSKPFSVMFEKLSSVKNFFKTYGAYLLVSILTALWSILLVIPGIIKSISYSLVPFLLYDEPQLTIWQTLKKSEAIMKGYKGIYFLLMLSFIGWFILGAFTFGLLYIWLIPYVMSSRAMFYDEVRRSYYNDDPARNSEAASPDFTPNSSSDSPFSDTSFDDATTNDAPFAESQNNDDDKPFSDL